MDFHLGLAGLKLNKAVTASRDLLIHAVISAPLLRLAANHRPANAPPKWAICPPALLEVMNNRSVTITINARYFRRTVPKGKDVSGSQVPDRR